MLEFSNDGKYFFDLEGKLMNLTLEQRSAVETDANNVLVSAGAGSGKTSVITERLRYLISEKEVDPSTIVCITFTKNAAEELKVRLADVDDGNLFIGTIHAFAYKLLGEDKEFELYSDSYDCQFHKKLIKENAKYLTYEKWEQFKELQRKFNKSEATEDEVNGFLTNEEKTELDLMNGASLHPESIYDKNDFNKFWNYKTIVDLCLEANVITFDELIYRATEKFKKDKIKLSHVLVDEFQDVGHLEYQFIKSLKAENYYFCGDDFQSIYGFKGADPSIFVSLSKKKNFKVYKLTKNFRCDLKILQLADMIIQGIPADKKLDKVVVGNSTKMGEVDKEDYSIFELISHLEKMTKEQLKNTFILVRGNGLLQDIKVNLIKNKINPITFNQADYSLEELKKLLEQDEPKLLTIHAAKGLEADNVFLIGGFSEKVDQWKIKAYDKETEEGLEHKYNIWEEQRIYYVGVTRARHNLTVMKTGIMKKKAKFEWNPMESLKFKEGTK